MAKETATYISQLVATNPVASDSVSVGDDHLRMLKTVLKTQFSGLSGTTAISSSEAELNILDGVTSTAAELNILDGVTSTAAELNILDGVTSTAAELNILDGVTSTAAELNILDGVTSTAAELNYLDLTTLGTSADSKALTQASGVVTIAGDVVVSGTTPKVTIGDAGEEDTTLLFDGNAKDFYVALDDSADKLVIGEGSTVGTNSILTITDDTVTLGDGAAADTYLNFDGNAVDFRIGIDDGTDKLEIGAEVAHGTTAAIAIDANADMLLGGYLNFQDEQAIRPEIKDYAETINVLGDTGGGTDAIDVSAGNVVTATVSTGTQEFTFTNPSGTGKACSFTLHLTNGGSQTVNWPSSVDWAGGSAPDLTSSGLDVLTFTTIDEGTTWLGFLAGADVS